MQEIIDKIVCNRIECKKCGDITESITRHDCKKVYGFIDVKYKNEKYREI